MVSLHFMHIVAQLCLFGLAAWCYQIDTYPRLKAAMKVRRRAKEGKR